MTDRQITLRQPSTLEPPSGAGLATITGGHAAGLQVLAEWVAAARQAESLVSPLVDTPFLPASLWPLPPGVQPRDMPNPRLRHPRESIEEWQGRRQVACSSGTAAVLTGMTLGLDPLVALAQVYVVKGRPGLYAKIKVALAQRAGHDIWDEELTPERVTVCGRRKDWPEDRVVRITITMEDAERAQWTRNDTYAKTPADMLWSRAVGRVLDRIAADTLNGIPSIETIDDDAEPPAQVTAEVTDLPARTSAAAILARAATPVPAPAAGPVAAAAEAAPAPADPEVERVDLPASAALLEVIKALFEQHGVAGRSNADKAARLAIFSAVLDREITTPPALSTDEAKLVRDNLMGAAGRRLVAQVLNRPDPAQEQADPGHLEDAAAREEAATGQPWTPDNEQLHDPTTESGWTGGGDR